MPVRSNTEDFIRNTFKLRETLKVLTTIFIWKLIKRTRLIVVPIGKNVRNM